MKQFDELFEELSRKVREGDPASGTVARVRSGPHDIGKKIIEEAAEVWMAAEHQSREQLAEEISQLLYHIQVMMLAKGISPADVYRFL